MSGIDLFGQFLINKEHVDSNVELRVIFVERCQNPIFLLICSVQNTMLILSFLKLMFSTTSFE